VSRSPVAVCRAGRNTSADIEAIHHEHDDLHHRGGVALGGGEVHEAALQQRAHAVGYPRSNSSFAMITRWIWDVPS